MKKAIFFIIFFLLPYFSLADSIAVAPTSINLEENERNIFIINPSSEELSFSIKHNLPKEISISELEGTIAPYETKEITINLLEKAKKKGIYSLIISKTGTGIRPGVKVEVRVEGKNEDKKRDGKLMITIMIGTVAATSLAILLKK
jgi:hypothetical protein